MILVILALLILLKFDSPSVYMDYLIGLVLVLCLASAAFTLWVRNEIHIEVDTQTRRMHEGDDLDVTVRVVSPDFYGKLRADVELANLQRGRLVTEKRWLKDHRCELLFSGLETGTVEIKVPYVEVFGIFGILRLKKRNAFTASFNVYPNAGPSPDRHVRISYIPGDGEMLNAKGDDYSEIYDVRPLQEGDDLRHIHRQLSARHDEYIVKVGSDSRRPVYNYFVNEGLDFSEMTQRIAQMFTLKQTLDSEEGALMSATYKGRFFEIAFDSQLYGLADLIYKDYLPEAKKAEGGQL